MAKTVYHEAYGEVEVSTLNIIRKRNVSPADFDELCGVFGCDEEYIRDAIEEYSPHGFYNQYLMINDRFTCSI
jgi:hypothetical protein